MHFPPHHSEPAYCDPIHKMPVRNSVGIKWTRFATVWCRFRVWFFLSSTLPWLLLTIIISQNVSLNRNETLTVTCSDSAETVEFRYGFKLLRLALRFNVFSWRYRVNATPKRKNFVPFCVSCERGRNLRQLRKTGKPECFYLRELGV